MKLSIKKEVNVEAKTILVHVKVRDAGSYVLLDDKKETIKEIDDEYVPSFFPGEHYGDYLILDIDIETGKINNWKKPSSEEIEQWLGEDLL